MSRFAASSLAKCSGKQTPDEQRAKAREHQKRWREKLKANAAKSAEYRVVQRERTRVWKEKLRGDEERYEELSRKHQERCKKWWERLTPEQRREKRRQYNMKWKQNQKKSDNEEEVKDFPDAEVWHMKYEEMMENESGNKSSSEYYSKSNAKLFCLPVLACLTIFFLWNRCEMQDSIQRGAVAPQQLDSTVSMW